MTATTAIAENRHKEIRVLWTARRHAPFVSNRYAASNVTRKTSPTDRDTTVSVSSGIGELKAFSIHARPIIPISQTNGLRHHALVRCSIADRCGESITNTKQEINTTARAARPKKIDVGTKPIKIDAVISINFDVLDVWPWFITGSLAWIFLFNKHLLVRWVDVGCQRVSCELLEISHALWPFMNVTRHRKPFANHSGVVSDLQCLSAIRLFS